MYFEETEYCYRAKKKGYNSYQINKSKVKTIGRSIEKEISKNENFNNLLIWHFIWSKFHFNQKKYGKFLSVMIFIPIFIRINFKILFYKILRNENMLNKYKFRLDGLVNSIQGKKSSLRP